MKTVICACAVATACAAPAWAEDVSFGDGPKPEIVVTANREDDDIANPPNTAVTVDAEAIRTRVNAVSVEDTLKFVPGLIVRKRHAGDNFAPIATRTSGLGSSARSLIYADGILLSALINNNNGNGSPKWQLVAPEEVSRIDVLYGPYSAAYSGNGIGTVVNITTRMPDHFEASLTALGNVQWHKQYATSGAAGTGQFSGSLGDHSGRLGWFASATHTISNGQPIAYVTASAAPVGTSGAIPTFNRLSQPIVVLGASDIDHHVEDTFKLKLTYDLGTATRASYVAGLFLDDSRAEVDSYLRNASGVTSYTSGFNSGFYLRENRHWAHALSFDGRGKALDWQVIGTLYDYARDRQASPSALLPGGATGGAGTVQDQRGTGWLTLDAKAALRSGQADFAGLSANVVSVGGHLDRYTLQSRSFAAAAWRDFSETTLTAVSQGKTRTAALWLQDQIRLAPGLALTLGARQEWWRAYAGFNKTTAANPGISQAERRSSGFSPKAAIEWHASEGWSARLSLAQAWRFPTVGELYGATTVGTVLANPNPNLRPERARSAEFALERKSANGQARLSLFNEVVDGALISQTGTISAVQPNGSTVTTTASFVQNVDRTRARGIELALDYRDVLPGIDFAGSITYADAITARDGVFPAAVGKLLPSVPHWKGNVVVTWRPNGHLALTGAVRFSSRNYATLDNSDTFGDTYQGFDRFVVLDLRARYRLSEQADLALGVDNLNNRRYFLFHPFPRRSISMELHYRF